MSRARPPSRRAAAALLAAAGLCLPPGCSSLACGPGTTQKVDPATNQAQCVAVVATQIPCDTDGGARIVGGLCQGDPEKFPRCGGGTTLDVDAGACVPSGGGGPPSCPRLDAAHVCVSGTVRMLRDGGSSAGRTLEVRAYEPLSFLKDPRIKPLGTAVTDASGGYLLPALPAEALKTTLVAIAVTDVGGPSQYALSGSGANNVTGGNAYTVDLWAVERQTVAGWDQQAGLSGAATFEMSGAYLGIFLDGPGAAGRPVAGVTMTVASQPAGDVFYFKPDRATLDLSLRATDASTGSLVQRTVPNMAVVYSGRGGGVAHWEMQFGASTAGVVFVQVFRPAPAP